MGFVGPVVGGDLRAPADGSSDAAAAWQPLADVRGWSGGTRDPVAGHAGAMPDTRIDSLGREVTTVTTPDGATYWLVVAPRGAGLREPSTPQSAGEVTAMTLAAVGRAVDPRRGVRVGVFAKGTRWDRTVTQRRAASLEEARALVTDLARRLEAGESGPAFGG